MTTRIRKNIAHLTSDELDKVKEVFRQMMSLPQDDPNSYYAQAGIHWLPPPTSCLHHEPRFLSWHRAYLRSFEDAMRMIDADVTLPYWDVRTPPPDFLFQEPFDKIVHNDLPLGLSETNRNSQTAADVHDGMNGYDVVRRIRYAHRERSFDSFSDRITGVHDNGHHACGDGGSMSMQEVAAFDPIFWFYHAFWDYQFWMWQTVRSATSPTGLAAVSRDPSWLDLPVPPFAGQARDFVTAIVGYEELSHRGGGGDVLTITSTTAELAPLPSLGSGQNKSNEVFTVQGEQVSLRVKNVPKIDIMGTFVVDIIDVDTLDKIASQVFFQPMDPRTCNTCAAQEKTNIDFLLEPQEITGRKLSVEISVVNSDFDMDTLDLSDVTINVRYLLQDIFDDALGGVDRTPASSSSHGTS